MPHTQHAGHAGVQVQGVRRTFGAVPAVVAMDLDAPPGQVTALVGPNGAGKTTLLLVLATLLRPEAGWARVAGYDPVSQPREVRARMGWAPDVLGFYDALTVGEYLGVMAAAHRLPTGQRPAAVEWALDTARLRERAAAPVHTLSRGQKQRLSLARALIHQPAVLLLDEPAAGLDPRARVDLQALLRGLADEGRTILVSSHALADLEELADRVVFVDAGHTVATHRPDELPQTLGPRAYRVRTTDLGRLTAALDALRVASAPAGTAALDVHVIGGEPVAAQLLSELVGAGVPVTAYAPVGGNLEAAYLQITRSHA